MFGRKPISNISATPRFLVRPVFDARCSMLPNFHQGQADRQLADGTVKRGNVKLDKLLGKLLGEWEPKSDSGNVRRIPGFSHVTGYSRSWSALSSTSSQLTHAMPRLGDRYGRKERKTDTVCLRPSYATPLSRPTLLKLILQTFPQTISPGFPEL